MSQPWKTCERACLHPRRVCVSMAIPQPRHPNAGCTGCVRVLWLLSPVLGSSFQVEQELGERIATLMEGEEEQQHECVALSCLCGRYDSVPQQHLLTLSHIRFPLPQWMLYGVKYCNLGSRAADRSCRAWSKTSKNSRDDRGTLKGNPWIPAPGQHNQSTKSSSKNPSLQINGNPVQATRIRIVQPATRKDTTTKWREPVSNSSL